MTKFTVQSAFYSRDKQRVLMSLDMSAEATRRQGCDSEDMDTGISWIKPFELGLVFFKGRWDITIT
jgi:hypothetical protein